MKQQLKEQLEKQKTIMGVINHSDLDNWDPLENIKKSQGKQMYVLTDGLYKKPDKSPSNSERQKHNKIIYKTPEEIKEINRVLLKVKVFEQRIKTLKGEVLNLINED